MFLFPSDNSGGGCGGGVAVSIFVVHISVKYVGEFQPGRDTLLSPNPDNLSEIPQYRL